MTGRRVFVPASGAMERHYWDYAVHPDGRRLLMVRLQSPPQAEELALQFVENFFAELRAKVPR